MEEHIIFKNSKNRKLAGVLHIPEDAKNCGGKGVPAIVCCHGFSGDKVGRYRILIRIARELCKSGFFVLRFDFSGHGDSEGEMEDTSISQELDDLECGMNYLKSHSGASIKSIGLIGHSLGGEIAILEAAKNPSINAVVLLAPVVDSNLLTGDFPRAFNEIYGKNAESAELASHMMKKRYFEELRKFKPLGEAEKIVSPVLIIHGDADDAVDILGSKYFIERANGPKKLVIIEGADHNFFGCANTTRVIKEANEWFVRWLGQ